MTPRDLYTNNDGRLTQPDLFYACPALPGAQASQQTSERRLDKATRVDYKATTDDKPLVKSPPQLATSLPSEYREVLDVHEQCGFLIA